MSNPEIPEDFPFESSINFVGDFIPDEMFFVEHARRNEALQQLEVAIGHAALISANTWPNSVHSFKLEDGDITIRTMSIKTNRAGECLNVTVNKENRVNDDGGMNLEVHDFVLSSISDIVLHKKTIVERDYEDHSWLITGDSGPVLYKMFDTVSECRGETYTMPQVTLKRNNNETYMNIIDEAKAAEHLASWLFLMNETSYDEYPSRGI